MAESPRVQTRIDPLLAEYLEDIIKTKLYGRDEGAVLRNFIETGIRNAITAGHIKRRNEGDEE
ncbi:MAG: hypothetical protein AB7F91_17845 [Parvularculaceae bacterium]